MRSRFLYPLCLGKMFGRNGNKRVSIEQLLHFVMLWHVLLSFLLIWIVIFHCLCSRTGVSILLYCLWCTAQAYIGITYLFSHLIISAFPVSVRGMRSVISFLYCLYDLEDWLGAFIRKWV